MAKPKDTVTFNRERFEGTLSAMRARGESVEAVGQMVFETTGKVDPLVNIFSNKRVSRNAFAPPEKGKYQLKNGISLPIASAFDGTASMAENIDRAFYGLGQLFNLLAPIRSIGYNTQIATGLVQDVSDDRPVVQMSQFESDERVGEQLRLLTSAHNGGDATEDYDLMLAYWLLAVDFDIFNFYGLKAYGMIVGDQIGRGGVSQADVAKYLGHTMQASHMTTKSICRELNKSWHMFYIQVGSGGGARRNSYTEWWEDKLGHGRVIVLPDPDLIGEVQAGLVYATEMFQPEEQDFVNFLVEGSKRNKQISKSDARNIWRWITEAGVPLGAQAKLADKLGVKLPKPGDLFADIRNPWPIGHEMESQNTKSSVKRPVGEEENSEIDWSTL